MRIKSTSSTKNKFAIVKSVAFGLIALPILFSNIASAQTITLDRIAAIVDDDVVMESELNSQLRTITARLQSQEESQQQLPPEDVLKAQILEHLVVQQLQLQMASRAGATVEDAEVNASLTEMQQRSNLSPEDFLAQLKSQGLSIENLREDIRRELLITNVQRGVLLSRIQITEHDVNSFLKSKEGQFWNSPDYLLAHILIPLNTSASEEQVQATLDRAIELRQQILDGADFGQIATTYSGGQNALQGGDLGWRKAAQLPQLFAEQITTLNVGDTSEPFRSDAGFHMLKIREQRGGEKQLVEQTKVSHIILIPSIILSDVEAKRQLADIRKQIVNGADFAELAKEHSEDGSAISGGDLGWTTPGNFYPEFEVVMNETAIGEMSEPFETRGGIHILKIEDRRQEDMSEEFKRSQARNLLMGRQFEEELPIWLQEIRDSAYVEIKLASLRKDEEETEKEVESE